MSKEVQLPKLDWKYDELEPYIAREINEIHHTKHHQTYVTGFNNTLKLLFSAEAVQDVSKIHELQSQLKFFSGGHINHCLFWKNLSPVSAKGGEVPREGSFYQQVIQQYGSFEKLMEISNAKLAGIQGSGWLFISKNKAASTIELVTTYNQDSAPSDYQVLVAIDAWEHAYYLQYQNKKLDYFKAIWNVINWEEASRRWSS